MTNKHEDITSAITLGNLYSRYTKYFNKYPIVSIDKNNKMICCDDELVIIKKELDDKIIKLFHIVNTGSGIQVVNIGDNNNTTITTTEKKENEFAKDIENFITFVKLSKPEWYNPEHYILLPSIREYFDQYTINKYKNKEKYNSRSFNKEIKKITKSEGKQIRRGEKIGVGIIF